MSGIDCVIFDIGNVLIHWDPRNLYRKLGYSDSATAAALEETKLLDINHRKLDAGGSFRDTFDALVERFPQHADFIQAFDTQWAEMLGGPIDATFAVKAALRHNGVPVHAISNFHREKFDIARAMFPALDEFDELVISGDVGLVKPDAEIFELLIARGNLEVARTVFIDDVADNITTARRLGFQTIHYSECSTDLEAALLQVGLPVSALSCTDT